MTTPNPQGGFINNLLGGLTGSLAGTNPLQSSIDQLTNAVNKLSGQMSTGGTLTMSSAANQQGNYTGSLRFPSMNSPGMSRQPGIGGGGPGGAGNVSRPMPFGRMAIGAAGVGVLGGSFANYGQQQMPFQLGLNAYASMSMMGMNNAGMGNYGQNASILGNQPGMPISSSSLDYLQMMQSLSFLGGAPNYMSTSLGRSGFGAAAAFGLTNPTLSGAMSGNLAQQIYNPMLSMRMRLLGYGLTPRTMGSGMPQAVGSVAASLIQGWYGRSRINPATLYRSLSMGGKDFTSLQALGLNPQQMAPLLEGFNKLFNAGYSPEAASTLFSQAASNNPAISRQAQRRLTQAGVTSVSSDIQKMRNNQAQVTQRSVNTAAGFNAALTASTDSLERFNQALNLILNKTGMNGPLGALGGGLGVLSGTNHGNMLSGLGGLGLLGLAFRGAGLGGAAGAGGGGLLGSGAFGMAGGLGPLGIGVGAGAALRALGDKLSPAGTPAGRMSSAAQMTGIPGSGISGGFFGWLANLFMSSGGSSLGSGSKFNMPNVGGGAGSAVQTSSQQSTKGGSRSMNSGISSSAVKAVSSAESQLGVPYVWGGEQPGVGFDCSGLVQWAYRQAGVSLPRTSQQQWSSLKRKRVPLSQVQEGDIVFAAGSDGTPTAPGHEGMMINKRQLIQAPFTGENVQIIGFNPHDWVGAARPSGRSGPFISANNGPGNNLGNSSSPGLFGNRGAAMGVGGNYGSVNEVDAISGTGGFMGAGIPPFLFGGAGNAMGTNPGSKAGSTIGGRGPRGNGSRSIAAEKAFAMQLLKARGWGGQFGDLNNIIMAESSWRWNATNPSSGAYGIPQALPGSKMAAAGKDWRTNPDTQLRWLVDMYIPQRYGTPANAWAFHQSHGWYGGGGVSRGPGMRVVGDRGPELQVDTGGGGTLTINNAQTMSLLKAISNPQQTPWKNFTASNGGHMIYPGQPVGGGVKVNVTFGQNAININVNSSTSDTQSTGRSVAKQIIQQIQQEDLWMTIGQGSKN